MVKNVFFYEKLLTKGCKSYILFNERKCVELMYNTEFRNGKIILYYGGKGYGKV